MEITLHLLRQQNKSLRNVVTEAFLCQNHDIYVSVASLFPSQGTLPMGQAGIRFPMKLSAMMVQPPKPDRPHPRSQVKLPHKGRAGKALWISYTNPPRTGD